MTERRAGAGSVTSAAGERREVPVAVMSLEVAGPRIFALFANGLLEAGRQSEGRYKYSDVPLDFFVTEDWSMSRTLAAVEASAPELVAYFDIDLEDLVAHDQLTPLGDFLAADPDFDPGAFWPGVLESGRHDGEQFGPAVYRLSPSFALVKANWRPSGTLNCPSQPCRPSPPRPSCEPRKHSTSLIT